VKFDADAARPRATQPCSGGSGGDGPTDREILEHTRFIGGQHANLRLLR
jgi:hypothetical protein